MACLNTGILVSPDWRHGRICTIKTPLIPVGALFHELRKRRIPEFVLCRRRHHKAASTGWWDGTSLHNTSKHDQHHVQICSSDLNRFLRRFLCVFLPEDPSLHCDCGQINISTTLNLTVKRHECQQPKQANQSMHKTQIAQHEQKPKSVKLCCHSISTPLALHGIQELSHALYCH